MGGVLISLNVSVISFLMFSEVVGNEYVPALMLIENPEKNPKSSLYAPERDYNELEDAVKIIKEFYER